MLKHGPRESLDGSLKRCLRLSLGRDKETRARMAWPSLDAANIGDLNNYLYYVGGSLL